MPMISPEVRSFLAKYVDSAELLDILMLMHREPDGNWTAESLSNKVFTVPQAAQKRLDELAVRGLVAERAGRPGSYVLQQSDPQLVRALAGVRAAYDESRANVINAVFSMKADPLKSFSDAFKLRGES